MFMTNLCLLDGRVLIKRIAFCNELNTLCYYLYYYLVTAVAVDPSLFNHFPKPRYCFSGQARLVHLRFTFKKIFDVALIRCFQFQPQGMPKLSSQLVAVLSNLQLNLIIHSYYNLNKHRF